MANLNVAYEDMTSSASKLTNGMQQIDEMLTQLKSEVDQLVHGGFVTDQASKAFESSYEEFNTGCTQVIGGLEGMASYLNRAAAAMQDMDQQLARAIQN